MGCELALLFFLVVGLGKISPSAALTEGGPSPFGYDASSACSSDRHYSRVGRARDLPCDFKNDNWCTVAGNQYPWHAMRKFVQENQGLMKRMYGDEKSISVIKNEINEEEVELELEDKNNRLYYDDGSSPYKQFKYDLDNDIIRNSQSSRLRDYYGRSFGGPSRQAEKPLPPEEDETDVKRVEPLPIDASSTTSPPSSTTPTVTSSSTTSTPATDKAGPTAGPTSTTTATSTSTSTSKSTSTTTTEHPTSSSPPSSPSPSPLSSLPPLVVSLAQIAKIQNLSINEVHGQIDRFDPDVGDLTELPVTSQQPEYQLGDHAFDKQQFRPRPEYRPPEVTIKPEQLFQDVAAKDKSSEEPVLKVRGVDACPVRDEVVAPLWANNTRGEVLALLNEYPFEQYVHWQKCTHENKQMYCRDGCRCEQQYRLHRLLAFDPTNECRGIFSDWFKFPSCCVCRCYFDMPVEFRVTSRSPRQGREKRKLKVHTPQSPPPLPRINSRQSRDFL